MFVVYYKKSGLWKGGHWYKIEGPPRYFEFGNIPKSAGAADQQQHDYTTSNIHRLLPFPLHGDPTIEQRKHFIFPFYMYINCSPLSLLEPGS